MKVDYKRIFCKTEDFNHREIITLWDIQSKNGSNIALVS